MDNHYQGPFLAWCEDRKLWCIGYKIEGRTVWSGAPSRYNPAKCIPLDASIANMHKRESEP